MLLLLPGQDDADFKGTKRMLWSTLNLDLLLATVEEGI